MKLSISCNVAHGVCFDKLSIHSQRRECLQHPCVFDYAHGLCSSSSSSSPTVADQRSFHSTRLVSYGLQFACTVVRPRDVGLRRSCMFLEVCTCACVVPVLDYYVSPDQVNTTSSILTDYLFIRPPCFIQHARTCANWHAGVPARAAAVRIGNDVFFAVVSSVCIRGSKKQVFSVLFRDQVDLSD